MTMNKISLRKGILTAGLMMALSPAALLADTATAPAATTLPAQVPAQPSRAEMQEEIEKLEQEQQRINSELRQQRNTRPNQYEQIQDIPNPKDLGSD
jgi:hypothetical protein